MRSDVSPTSHSSACSVVLSTLLLYECVWLPPYLLSHYTSGVFVRLLLFDTNCSVCRCQNQGREKAPCCV